MSMRAGRLDRRILIEKNTPAQATTGEPKEVWSTVATVWAGIDQSRGATRFIENQRLSGRTLVMRIRYRTDITEKMRFTFDSNIFYITAIEKIALNEGLRISGVAQVPPL